MSTSQDNHYAIIRAKGKQFEVRPGTRLIIDRLAVEAGQEISLDDVLVIANGEDATAPRLIGTPTIEGASVKGIVVRHGRGEKILVYKKKRRQGYTKKRGHRQEFTEVLVQRIAV